MKIVIGNIFNNAVKFSNRNGHIQIYSISNNDNIEIHISDDGVGMDENTIKNLFNISETNSSKGTAGEKGTGLGLIICKELIEMNNGDIIVNSKPGKGSDFSIVLPSE